MIRHLYYPVYGSKILITVHVTVSREKNGGMQVSHCLLQLVMSCCVFWDCRNWCD